MCRQPPVLVIVALLTLGCGAETPSEVPLAKAVRAALADPGQLPRASTPTDVAAAGAVVERSGAPAAAPDGRVQAPSPVAGSADVAPTEQPPPREASAAAEAPAPNDPPAGAPPPGRVAAPRAARPEGPATEPVAKPARAPAARRNAQKPARKRPATARKPRPSTRKASVERVAAARPGDQVPLPPGKDATDLYYEGKRAHQARKYGAAIAALRASQQLRASPRTLTLLGKSYLDANRLKEAERALSRAGNQPDALLLLATLHQQKGRSAKARRALKAFLTYHSNHRRANWAREMLKTL